MKYLLLACMVCFAAALGVCWASAADVPAAVADAGGGFFRESGFNGSRNSFRVNSPDTATGPYRDRPEAKQTGRMALAVDADLSHLSRADLYLELWGGHPGVADKRFTLNGKSTYALPEVGAAAGNCTYSYPAIPLKLDELVRGENAFQFTCDKGSTFWGHYIVRAACVRLALRGTHPTLAQAGLAGFAARIRAVPCQGETLMLTLECPGEMRDKIASVEFHGRYDGYDENGNREGNDWHGFTRDGAPVGLIAVADKPPFDAVFWDLSMVPDQKNMAVRAVVRFKKPADLAYVTPEAAGLGTPARKARVRLFSAADLPRPFWSREDKKKTCTVQLDADPATIERAQLHIAVWDGGRGNVPAPLRLNGTPLPTPNWTGDHSLRYTVIDVAPPLLRRGANEVVVHSDTEHHGIEVCLPGPALVVRLTGESRPAAKREP